jgi:O-methyltransferase domain
MESLDKYAAKFDTVSKQELRTAFNLAFNTDMHYFDYIYTPENIPKYGERFGRSMVAVGSQPHLIEATISCYDWSTVKAGDKVVDVGGGLGHIGLRVATKVPKEAEVIIQDRPSVVEQGRQTHGDKLSWQAHDFFEEQPVLGAKIYYMRHILHDWPDGVCKSILKPLVKAMNKDSKLLLMEGVCKDDECWVNGKDDDEIIGNAGMRTMSSNTLSLHMMNKLGIVM